MRGESNLARAVRDAARRAAQWDAPDADVGVVASLSPLTVELAGSSHVLEEGEDFVLGHGVRTYDVQVGIAVGDSLVLVPARSGDWLAVDVVSDAEPTALPVIPSHTIIVAASGGDFTTIQAALAAVPSRGAKIVVRAGDYTLASMVDLAAIGSASGLILEGEGMATRLIFSAATVPTAIGTSDTTLRAHIHLRDMRISKSNNADGGTAIDWSYVNRGSIENVVIDNAGAGIGPEKCIAMSAGSTYYNLIRQCRLKPGGSGTNYGVFIDNLCNENTLERIRVQSNAATIAYYVGHATANCLLECECETGAAVGIDLGAESSATEVIGCYLEGNAINLRVQANARVNTIMGGKIAAGTTYNIQDLGGNGTRYVNVEVEYKPFNFRTAYGGSTATTGLALPRWIGPMFQGFAGTDQTLGALGVFMHEFEVLEDCFVDAAIVPFATAAGDGIFGIAGPVTVAGGEETPGAVVIEGKSGTVTLAAPTTFTLTAATRLRAGRHYAVLICSDATAKVKNNGTIGEIGGTVAAGAHSSLALPAVGAAMSTIATPPTNNPNARFEFRLRCVPTFAII